MKVSLSIPAEDLAFLDAYVDEHALPSRSAGVHAAIRALRTAALPAAYAGAWADFDDEAGDWEPTAADGLS